MLSALRSHLTLSWGNPEPRAWVLLLAFVAAYLGYSLFGGLPSRAFDPSDPTEEITDSMTAVSGFRQGGCVGWASKVASNPNAKPALYAVLSLGYLAGLPEGHVGYKIMVGAMILLLGACLQWALLKRYGALALAFGSGLIVSSNLLLAYALWGGSIWAGQLFLWAAVLLAAGRWKETVASPPRSFLFGLLLSLSFMASYSMGAFAAAMAAAWSVCWAVRVVKGDCERVRPAAALLAGALIAPLGLEAVAFAVTKPHYWSVVSGRLRYALGENLITGGAPAFLADLLGSNESRLFIAVVVLGVLLDLLAHARDALRKSPGASSDPLFAAVPALVLAYFALGTSPRLGRVFLPLLPFLLVSAGAGLARAVESLPRPAWRWSGALALCAFLAASAQGRQGETRRAFRAGERLIEHMGGGEERLLVIGYSVPYQYLPGRETRVGSMADLAAKAQTGDEWVLASRFSNWFRRDFTDERDPGAVPIARAFSSDRPFTPVPGVESLPFEAFTNSDLYARIRAGKAPFPVENRLYRAREFLSACSSSSTASSNR